MLTLRFGHFASAMKALGLEPPLDQYAAVGCFKTSLTSRRPKAPGAHTPGAFASPLAVTERLGEVFDQIVDGLDPDRQPQQRRWRW